MAGLVSTARFGAGELSVTFPTSQWYGDAPRTIAFCAPIQLNEADLVAALWVHAESDIKPDALTDLDNVRDLVADAIVNWGLVELGNARATLEDLVPGTVEHAWLQQVQAAVRAAFASVLAAPAGRAFVGVA